jgi:hypothetical protein
LGVEDLIIAQVESIEEVFLICGLGLQLRFLLRRWLILDGRR